jgi:large subunit ribosomal protein L1
MGKIRIKTFDESSVEDDAKLKAKREAKKAEKMAKKNAEKANVVEVEETIKTPEETVETANSEVTTPEETIETVKETVETKKAQTSDKKEEKKKKKEKFAKANAKTASKRHKENELMVSKGQSYTLDQAIEALRKFKKSNFDETIELHINTKEKGVSGQITLPHGTGKTLNIKVADDALLSEVAKGKITFDVLVAHPSMMPSLAKVARVLGPRGLMPNPKNGTISDNPKEAVEKLSGGQINYKTESQAPIIHTRVGKMSFEDKQIKENVSAFIASLGNDKIKSVTLKSTMSPAIRLVI